VELAASESGAPGKGARAGPAGEAVLHQIFGSPPLVPSLIFHLLLVFCAWRRRREGGLVVS
jgi:hypothetical protein